MRRDIGLVGLLLTLGLLGGCASQSNNGEALEAARTTFQKVKEDPDVLRVAPKDVIRAGESLARADRLSSYWGSGSDVDHYAYLSQRYSEIAIQHTELKLNEERRAKLDLIETHGGEIAPYYWAGFTLVGEGSAPTEFTQ